MKTRFDLEQDIVRVDGNGSFYPFHVRGCYIDLVGDVFYTNSDSTYQQLWTSTEDLFLDIDEAQSQLSIRADLAATKQRSSIAEAAAHYRALIALQEVQS